MRSFGIGVIAAVVGALSGCGSQIGEENAFGCLEDSREALAGDALADGFSATPDELIAQMTGSFPGSSTLAESDTTVEVAFTGGAELVTRSWRTESGEGDMELNAAPVDCGPVIALPVDVHVVVGGQIDEAGSGELLVGQNGAGSVSWSVDHEDLQIPVDPGTFDPADMERTQLNLDLFHNFEGWTGRAMWLYEEPPSGSGDDATVAAGIEEFLEFTCVQPVG